MKNPFINHTEEQLETIQEFKANGKAFASHVFRNNGDVKPITIMFEAYSSSAPATVSSDNDASIYNIENSILSKISNISYLKRKTKLINLSEEQFDEYFSEYGYTSDMVDYPSRNSEGQLIALGVCVPMSALYDSDEVTIIQVDALESKVSFDDEGNPLNGFQEKQVDGETLTKDGEPIYMKRIFAPLGSQDRRIQQDQVFGNASNRDIKPAMNIEENKSNVQENVQQKVQDNVQEVEDDQVSFDF